MPTTDGGVDVINPARSALSTGDAPAHPPERPRTAQRATGVRPAGGIVELGLFYVARFLSQGGQALFLSALLLMAGSGTSGPLQLSGVFAATLAASVLLGLPAGALVDRLGAARGFGLGVALRLIAVTAAVAVSGAPSWAWAAAFAYSAGSQVFSSAEMALIPLLQRGGSARAHGLLIGLQYAGQGAGALALAPLLLLGGTGLVLAAAAVVYLLLVVPAGLLMLRLGQAAPDAHDPRPPFVPPGRDVSFPRR